MAFSETEKTRIRKLLGWGARYWQFDTILERTISAVEQTLPEETAQIQATLTALTDIDTKITDSLATVGVSGVSSIRLDSDQGISILKSEGRRLVEVISTMLQVPIRKNYYGGGMTGCQI